jgi:hypothetical protein
MKITTRFLLSATTAISLTAFTLFSAFSASASTPVSATSFGLLAIYGLVEIAIHSYAPRRSAIRSVTLPVVAPQPAPVVVEFPARTSHPCAA